MSSLTLHCQTLRARPRVRAVLLERLQLALDGLREAGFHVSAGTPDTFVSEAPDLGYPVCGYSLDITDPSAGSVLQLRSGLQLGSPDQDSFLCGFVLQLLRPDTVAFNDLVGRVLSSEQDRRLLCETTSASSPGACGWDVREGLPEVEALLEKRGHLDLPVPPRDPQRLVQQALQTLEP